MNCVKTSGLSLVRVRGFRILIIVHKTQSKTNKSISIDKKNKTTVNMQIRFQYFFSNVRCMKHDDLYRHCVLSNLLFFSNNFKSQDHRQRLMFLYLTVLLSGDFVLMADLSRLG